jgi:phage terminase large subunit-like protein
MEAKKKISKEKLLTLTKEQKLKLLDVLEEKKARKKRERTAFVPHEGQISIVKSVAKIRMVTAANGSGKTALAVNEVLWAAQGYNPITNKYTKVPATIYVVLDSPEKVQDVWIKELKKWAVIEEEQLHKMGKPYYTRITFPNGSNIRFIFHLMEPLAFESIELDWCFLDEPPPRELFIAMLRGGRTKGFEARYMLIGTPLAQPWMRIFYEEWEKGLHSDTEFFKMSTAANSANLNEGYIEAFSRHLTDREKATRLHGDFWSTDSLALASVFKRQHHVVPAASLPADYKTWPAVIAFDPHTSKPIHACLLLAGPDEQLVYEAEFKQKMLPRDVAKWMKLEWMSKYHVLDIISDSSGQADFTGGEAFKSFLEVMRSEGVLARATSYNEKSDEDFLTRLQEALYIPEAGASKLKINNTCLGLIKDIENVAWKPIKGTEDFQPKLEIGNKDYLACLKYALAANLTFESAKRKIIRPPNYRPNPTKIGKVEERWLAERNKSKLDDDW